MQSKPSPPSRKITSLKTHLTKERHSRQQTRFKPKENQERKLREPATSCSSQTGIKTAPKPEIDCFWSTCMITTSPVFFKSTEEKYQHQSRQRELQRKRRVIRLKRLAARQSVILAAAVSGLEDQARALGVQLSAFDSSFQFAPVSPMPPNATAPVCLNASAAQKCDPVIQSPLLKVFSKPASSPSHYEPPLTPCKERLSINNPRGRSEDEDAVSGSTAASVAPLPASLKIRIKMERVPERVSVKTKLKRPGKRNM